MPRLGRSSMLLAVILVACAFSPARAAQTVVQPSGVILQAAKVQAAQQKKLVFVVFGATWSQPCRALNTFMTDKQIHPILDKYFVPAAIHVSEEATKGGNADWNSFGGDAMMARFGGADRAGKKVSIPFFAFLDADGNLIVNSVDPMQERPDEASIGYPGNPEQITWLMTMFKMAVPAMTPEQSATIENWLKKHDPASLAPPAGGGRSRGR
jgi:hypothetical protein